MDMAFLLDTDVISETSRTRPDPMVVEFLLKADNLLLPAAALMELQKGITEICGRDPLKAVKLSAWYQELTSGEIPIVHTDQHIIDVWGTLSADPRLKNLIVPRPDAKHPRSGQDIHIAAAALVHRAAIATFNIKDFLLINDCYPLPGIYNPKEDMWYARMKPLTTQYEAFQNT
ncbi:PIN domain-containing protein [Ensifer sp. Root127]|uniref:PIN domain-containing protein n=1 Tax=Ensifer sp. Root127 TaxID=1736440 RepID=UPI00070F82E3|nr:PIN domain-containing protein [Ensifer sp. Root127]KQW82040.1 hypothetical protein ASD03_23260 [Ensifer sp. Root127]